VRLTLLAGAANLQAPLRMIQRGGRMSDVDGVVLAAPGKTRRCEMTRRELIAALASTTVLPVISGCGNDRPTSAPAPAVTEADARALLDEIADNLLRLLPFMRII
jgi:hypothetical protein